MAFVSPVQWFNSVVSDLPTSFDGAIDRIVAHQRDINSTASAIDAAAGFPVASTFNRDSDSLIDANAKNQLFGFDSVFDSANPEPVVPRPSSAQGVTYSPVAPATIDYLDADYAKHYGMSKETAYQEALANSSYQRAVVDMQRAGLNPAAIFGNGRSSGSGGVSYVAPASAGGVSRSGSGSSNDKLFDSGVYNGLSAIAGGIVAAMTGNPANYYTASTAAKGLMSLANSISNVGRGPSNGSG